MTSPTISCLIADPEEGVRNTIEASVASAAAALGLDVVTTTVDDGRAALQALRSRAPRLVITEVLLDAVNGLQLLRHCRDSVDTSDARWIFVTSLNDDTDRYWATLNDCDEYLSKPVSGVPLSAVLKKHLERISRGEARNPRREERAP
jgi:twitching motility two-component system response regulator PilH